MTTTTTTLTVPDISCGHCKESIEGAVGGLTGVDEVTVAIEPRTVALRFDTDKVGLDDIRSTIEGLGYDVADSS